MMKRKSNGNIWVFLNLAFVILLLASFPLIFLHFEEKIERIQNKVNVLEQLDLNRHHVQKRQAPNEHPPERNGITFTSGASYVRWGRMDCNSEAELVYPGYAAGAYYAHTGSGGNYICIHKEITYPEGKFVEGHQTGSYIYGVEWREDVWSNQLFNYSEIHSKSMYLQSLSCAVCLAGEKTSQIMIPGRETCPTGWTAEYVGYIMSGRVDDAHSTEYICVDETPVPILGTEGQQHGAYIALVEPECGYSLPCEPFVAHRELRCIVCSI